MRTFAILSFAVAALAAPAPFLPASVANVIAPVKVPANANANAATNVVANAAAAVGNVKATYNTIGDNDANDNNVKVLSRGLADVLAPVAIPAAVVANADSTVVAYANAAVANVNAQDNTIADNDANDNNVKVLSRGVSVKNVGVQGVPVNANVANGAAKAITKDIHARAVADAVAVVTAVVKGLVDLCTQVGVDAKAAIANVNLQNNQILNGVLNGNNVKVAKRGDVNALADLVTGIFAVVKALTNAGVDANAIIGNIDATCNSIGNNVGNSNNVQVLSRDVVDAVTPVIAVVTAFVQALTKVGVILDASVLNVALKNNQILNNVLNGNNVKVLSG